MEKSLLLIGGGGHCHSVADSVRALHVYQRLGIVDKTHGCLSGFGDIPFMGTDDELPRLLAEGWTDAFITVGSVGSTAARRRLFDILNSLHFNIPCIIDPSAVIADGVTVGSGSYVGKSAVLNYGTRVGKCAIINSGAIVEHDCIVGDFAHVSPGAVLCGAVSIGCDSHVGAGSVVRQQLSVGERVMVGMGSIVLRSLPDDCMAYGNPCRVVDE